NSEGVFILPDVPATSEKKDFRIRFNGSKIGDKLPYPVIDGKLNISPGRDNPFGIVRLQQINGPSLNFSPPSATMPMAKGAQTPTTTVRSIQNRGIILDVPGESSFSSPEGSKSGSLTLSLVENGRTPFTLPPGQFSPVVAQITSIGSTITPGGRLTFPNSDRYPPGAAVKLVRLEQNQVSNQIGSFVDVGTARVSADGQRIETSSNAITEASLYLVTNPNPTTTLTGRVLDSDNQTPVRNARVSSRGQESVTDGNGGFALRNVPAKEGDQLTVEASYLRPGGRVDRAQLGGIQPVVGGLTELKSPLLLSAENANRSPLILLPDELALNAGTTLELKFVVFDPDGDSFTKPTITGSGSSFATIVESSGQSENTGLYALRLRPASSDGGTFEISVSTTDSKQMSTDQLVRLKVNRPPIANPQQVTTSKNTPIELTLTGSDPDRDPISFLIVENPRFGKLTPALPKVEYRPDPTTVGTDSFKFKISDGQALSDEATVSIAITPINQTPRIEPLGSFTVRVQERLRFTVKASDGDATDLLELTATDLPGGTKFDKREAANPISSEFDWTPNFTQTGEHVITFTAKDNGSPAESVSEKVTITVVNSPPTLTVPEAQAHSAGQPLNFTVTASDPDTGQTLTLTAPEIPAGATFRQINTTGQVNGQFTWTPALSQVGSYIAKFRVSDSGTPTGWEEKTVTITVVTPNRAPSLTVPGPRTVKTGEELSFNVTASDPDDSQALSLTASETPTGASFNQIDRTTGRFSWTPAASQTGTFNVKLRVTDDGTPPLSDVKTVVITATAPNRPPTLTVPASQTVTVGQPMVLTVQASDLDVDQTLTLTADDAPIGSTFTQTSPTTGQFIWTPSDKQTGTFNVIFRVTDNGIPPQGDSKTLTISVNPNRAPVLSVPVAPMGTAGQLMRFTVSASDPDVGQVLRLTASILPDGASFIQTSATTGEFRWTPSITQIGSFSATLQVTDNGTPSLSEKKTVAIIVGAPNRPPQLTITGGQSITVGQQVSLTVIATDPDTGQELLLSATETPNGSTFRQNTATTGEFLWTPTTSQTGVFNVTFRVADNGTPSLTDTKTVAITVNANRAPVVTSPGTQTGMIGQLLSFTVSASDPDAGQTVSLTTSTLPTGVTFTPTSPTTWQFRWTPTVPQIGDHNVTFTVRDNGSPIESSSGTVAIRVNPVLRDLNFTTALVGPSGAVSRYEGRTTRQYEEELGDGVKLEMVLIPGGSYQMGTTTSEAGRESNEGPSRQVNVNGFVIGKYEVTQAQWRAVMGSNPSKFVGDNRPVEQVTWNAAQEFCRRLNARLGLSGINAYRLPTEAEWEYAARAAATTPFAFGTTISPEIVNYDGKFPYGSAPTGSSRGQTVVVGSLGVANGWGLYDLHGNVMEWCEDDDHEGYTGAPTDGRAWVETPRRENRIIRDGGWIGSGAANRAGRRFKGIPNYQTDALGLRLARTLPVEITLPNRAPVVHVPATQTVVAGQALGFTVSASDVDTGQRVVLTASSLPTGATFTSTDTANGQFAWTPGVTQTGTFTASFQVVDNGTPELSDTKTVTITVNRPNQPPTVTVPAAQVVTAGQALSFTVSASDPDAGQTVSLTAPILPTGANFIQTGATAGLFSWTPNGTQVGDHEVSFAARDSGSPTLTDVKKVTVTVNPNRPPSLTVPDSQTVTAKQPLSFIVTASDPDSGQALTLTAPSLPIGAKFTQTGPLTGQFSWTPAAAQAGNQTITFAVADNGSPVESTDKNVVVRVNLPLTELRFTTAGVTDAGVVSRFTGKPVQQYDEDLGGGLKLEVVLVPGGSFDIGSPTNEIGRGSDESPQQKITLNGFVMGKYEVTQAQWRTVMGSNPSSFTGDNFPVENVSWDEAQEFCRRLNIRLGLSGSNRYRLPSEAEWEFAARAGSKTPFTFGPTINPSIVNYDGSLPYGNAQSGLNRGQTVIVGSLGVANAWGLFDLHGNVFELCEDDFHTSYTDIPTDGRAWVDNPRRGSLRTYRGGAWNTGAANSRSADRYRVAPADRVDGLGFRLVRSLPPEISIPAQSR
ncbi:MAG: tandem-95 repeat protein, partial [Acidobacteria bacterium]|nr:tandem-95 repeat protein [Acidobacteriota bacterium]